MSIAGLIDSKTSGFQEFEIVEIQGKQVWVPLPVEVKNDSFVEWGGIIEKAMAAWLTVDGLPSLNFRLYGPPGCGKNAIVYHLGRLLKKDLYVINGHAELGPEDIACTPVMTAGNKISYVASPIFAGALRGGIVFLDEVGKVPNSALSPLASLLDSRRTLTSVQAGLHLRAHKDFTFCAALNEDEEVGGGLPGFFDERTRPSLYVGRPPKEILEKILRIHIPVASDIWFKVFLKEFWGKKISPRNGLTLLSHAYSMWLTKGRENPGKAEVREYLTIAKEGFEVPSRNQISEARHRFHEEGGDGGDLDVRFGIKEGELVH